MDIKFKDYTIGKPCRLGGAKVEPWEFTVHKLNKDGKTHFVIADFWYNFKEPGWDLKSVGTRLLEYWTPDLNKWLLKVMDLFECQLVAEEYPEEED